MASDSKALRRQWLTELRRAARECEPLLEHPDVRRIAACIDWLRAEVGAGHERTSLSREVREACLSSAYLVAARRDARASLDVTPADGAP